VTGYGTSKTLFPEYPPHLNVCHYGLEIIGRTNVGSHMWGMNRPDSDVDIFEIYVAETRDVLLGHVPKSYCVKVEGKNEDKAQHELGKVVNMLLAGNVNFVWGVSSPVIIYDTETFRTLRELWWQHKSKNLYHSVRGLALHNLKKLGATGMTEKKARTILRTIEMARTYLSQGGSVLYYPHTESLPGDYRSLEAHVLEKLDDLAMCYEGSGLPEKLEPWEVVLFEDFLVRERLARVK